MNSPIPPELQRLRPRLGPVESVLPAGTSLRTGAVLLLLYPYRAEPHFVLTRRPHTLSRHPGQLALPGGGAESVDASLLHTALRETREELGVDPTSVETLGALAPITVAASGYHILPFVGWTHHRPPFQPDPSEVADLIEIPLRTLLDESARTHATWTMRGKRWRVYMYQFGDHQVWGATARMLADFSARLSDLPMPDPAPGAVLPAE